MESRGLQKKIMAKLQQEECQKTNQQTFGPLETLLRITLGDKSIDLKPFKYENLQDKKHSSFLLSKLIEF